MSERFRAGERETAPRLDGEEANLLDYLGVIWRWRWLVFSLCAVTVGVTFVMTVLTPRSYEATATIVAPKEGSGRGFVGSLAAALAQDLPLAGLSVSSLTPNRDLAVSILKSRTVAEVIVDRFQLQARYEAKYREDAIKGVQGATEIRVSKEGVISVTVEDIDPALAAQIANFYVAELDKFVSRFNIGAASRQRVFLSEQLARAKADLDTAEAALRRFQQQNRAVSLQEQTRGLILAAAQLKGEITAAEVQLQVLANFATEANPEVIMLQRRIGEMKRQLAQMQYGPDTPLAMPRGKDQRDFTVPFPRVPEVGIELAGLTRNVKIQEALVTLLTQQTEQARLDEARDLPVVQVLDRAIPAMRPSKPKLRLNLAVAALGSLLVGVFLAFLAEYVQNVRAAGRNPAR